jgi:hypothetical protein
MKAPHTTLLTLLALALGAAACGDPLSNRLLLEDPLFTDSLPSREDVETVAPEVADEGARDLGDRATLVDATIAVSSAYNRTIFAMLGVLDAVIELDPTQREPDRRVWGPWAGRRAGSSVRLEVVRADGALFAYSLEVAAVPRWAVQDDTEWTALMDGVFERGGGLRDGTGAFRFDAGAWGIVDGRFEEARGTLQVAHERSGDRVAVEAVTDGWTPAGDEDPRSAIYTFRGGGGHGGFFEYETTGEVVGDGGLAETYVIRSRWEAGLQGRADFEVTGGAIGPAPAPGVECWDGALGRTYWSIDPPGTAFDEQEGSEAACTLDYEAPGSEPPPL